MSESPERDEIYEYKTADSGEQPSSARLVVEKRLTPSLTVSVDPKEAKLWFRRWYDVKADVFDGIKDGKTDFVPDSVVRLIDGKGILIYESPIKINDEIDQVALVLARIEKLWETEKNPELFWAKVCDLLIRYPIPIVQEIEPGVAVIRAIGWLELAIHWVGHLANVHVRHGNSQWSTLGDPQALIPRYFDFYNHSPLGARPKDPNYVIDLVKGASLLAMVKEAGTNDEKKKSLENLAGFLLAGISGFEILPAQYTKTGETDRVVRNLSDHPYLATLGSHLLVECKNQKETVSTDQVGTFISDVEDKRLKAGLFFAYGKFSPEAKAKIDNYYRTHSKLILGLERDDIAAMCNGASLVKMLMDRAETIILQKKW